MRSRSRTGAALLVLLAVSGCAGIPSGGSVHVGRQLAAPGGLGDVDVKVRAAGPTAGMSPAEVVRGFLRAMISEDGNYEVARSYLTSRAGDGWDPRARITTYDDSGVRVDHRRNGVIRFSAPRDGIVDQRGDFTPAYGRLHAGFRLVRQRGQWRINRLPSGALLSTTDAQRSFRSVNVYYADRTRTRLVPEPILVRPDPRGVPTALVEALVHGPGAWLAPAVRSGFPTGTGLAGTVPVDGSGTADINLTPAVRQASTDQLRLLTAQLAWTLRQVPGITGMRLLTNGVPLPGSPAVIPVAETAAAYDPATPPAGPGGFFRAASGWFSTDPVARLHGPPRDLTALAMSANETSYAGLRTTRRGVALVVGQPDGKSQTVLVADRMTPPAFTPDGEVLTVMTRGGGPSLVRVRTDGTVRRSPATGLLGNPSLHELDVSRDGARVAALVGTPGHERVVMGRIGGPAGADRLGGFRTLLPPSEDVRGLSWLDADQVVVTAADPAGGREVVAVDISGYSSHTVTSSRRQAAQTDVAAAPDRPLLVRAGRFVWAVTNGGRWRRLGAGRDPAYPG